ncbi:MAG: RNA polymerase sigma factor [Cyclobacteriaceae bacterium]|nr:RNA polymerase sigma factor [Cyclobacteriaceae bacterium]
MKPLSDNALMLKVKNGDLDKLGQLFERYKKPLYGFFYGLTRQQDASEDLIQNTFFRILKYRHLFREQAESNGGEFRAWMFHIARNVHYDQHRKKKLVSDDLENWKDRVGHTENKASEMQQSEELQLLAVAMDKLPLEKREIILLSKYEDMKYSEIGEVLGCSEGAVKVKVFRALQELKVIYKQLERIN